ncbi:N-BENZOYLTRANSFERASE putative-RELATED [Salix koriyanagi]|uniref:N-BENZOYLTRANSFERASE putative-RELATED n=1 Tax=Salix koriyanagi TaxID=2511006 RepID=A0A9Q0WZP0_9ROSI|nr:N-BENZOYLTRANSFERASE putative-RELATED [Salix koriyanagi]
MSDALGIVQLLNAIGEIARGAQAPSVLPVWQRELLCARNPPRVTRRHNEYGNDAPVVVDPTSKVPESLGEVHAVAHRTFVLNRKELSNIRRWIPSHLHPCSNFEVISACLWRCYAIASQANPNEEMRMQLLVNARSKFNPPLPKGYYGNVLALPAAVTNARKLCLNSLGYAMELIRNAKNRITEEYMRSLADLMEITKGQPIGLQSYVVSDLTSIGFDQEPISCPYRFKNGERGVMLLVSLRAPVMERFAILLEELARHDPERSQGQEEMILSSL